MIYFGQSRSELTVGVMLDVGSRVPISTSAMGRAYLWALPEDQRIELMHDIKEHV
jgi:DNA-binding IclR family transcriptional regulator